MNFDTRAQKGSTRRDFVKQVTVGAASVAAVSGLNSATGAAVQSPQGVLGPKNPKFAKHVKPINFQDPGSGSIRPFARMDSAYLRREDYY
jgi:hypothetical protein